MVLVVARRLPAPPSWLLAPALLLLPYSEGAGLTSLEMKVVSIMLEGFAQRPGLTSLVCTESLPELGATQYLMMHLNSILRITRGGCHC